MSAFGCRRLGVLAALCAAGCSGFGDLTDVRTVTPPAARCGECHDAIAEEWRASAHAAAFVSPLFRAASADAEFERCVPCHAPGALLFAPGRPAARAALREEGVHCLACHLDARCPGAIESPSPDPAEFAMAGPYPATGLVQPHPIVVRPDDHRSAAFCGRCHEGTYAEWQRAEGRKPTCQECHMPAVRRKMTQAKGLLSKMIVGFEDEIEGRAHRFSVRDAFAAEPRLNVAVRDARSNGAVTIRNTLPHALPTGDFGSRRVRIVARIVAPDGAERTWERLLVRRDGGSIPAGRTLELEVPHGEGERIAAVELRRDGRAGEPAIARWEAGDGR